MTSDQTVKPGDVVAGKYRVERLLGAGGMGHVFAARHLQLDQLVAMKFLRASAKVNREATTRFMREAQAVAKLRNEHIAKTYDVGSLETGEPYLVMEYLEGKDLASITRERPVLPASEACEYVLQACEALAEAHALGIVHRDIKLANIFVTRGPAGTPLVKVLDFGISKSSIGPDEHQVTNVASLLGSPRFMSPEQMRDARTVDARTDVWSLGVVLYRILSGKAPFEANALGRLIAMVMHEKQAPLTKIRPDLPAGLELIVSRCLEKAPDARYSSVADLAAALVPYCADATRARSAADRIAAILAQPARATVPPSSAAPSFKELPAPPPSRGSGTDAPWVGTPEISRRRKADRPLFLGAALVVLLALTVVMAKVRRDAIVQIHGARAPAAALTALPAPIERVEPTIATPAPEAPRVEKPVVSEPAPAKRAPAHSGAPVRTSSSKSR